MSIAEPIRKSPRRNGHAVELLPKPQTNDDINRLHDLAGELNGRPVPGVQMTEAEFERWGDEDVRAEWINREVILLSPSNLRHIRLGIWLSTLLDAIARKKQLGEVFAEPMIRLSAVKQQRCPDVAFVSRSRLKLLRDTYIDGAPDLVMEIVSPDSLVRDWREKYIAYEKSGVREYWVIDLESKRIEAYALGRDNAFSSIPETEGRIHSKVIRPFFLRSEWLWQIPLPDPARVLKEINSRR